MTEGQIGCTLSRRVCECDFVPVHCLRVPREQRRSIRRRLVGRYVNISDLGLDVSEVFDFFKQHYVAHVISDIRRKGTTDNMSTRPGEGFQ
jgi:hypothetical protein